MRLRPRLASPCREPRGREPSAVDSPWREEGGSSPTGSGIGGSGHETSLRKPGRPPPARLVWEAFEAGCAVTAALFPLVLMMVLGTSAQASSSPRPVTSLVTTEIAGTLSPGLSLSIVQVCPLNSSLDRVRSSGQSHRLPPNVRLISRELWPRGAVTRWRVTGSLPPKGDIVGSIQQTVACREPLRSTASHHDAGVSVLVRVWGPLTGKVVLDSMSTVRALWGSTPVGSDVEVVRLVTTDQSFANVSLGRHDQASVSAAVLAHLRAGQFAELRLDLQVRSHLRGPQPSRSPPRCRRSRRHLRSRSTTWVLASRDLPISDAIQSAQQTTTSVLYGSCRRWLVDPETRR